MSSSASVVVGDGVSRGLACVHLCNAHPQPAKQSGQLCVCVCACEWVCGDVNVFFLFCFTQPSSRCFFLLCFLSALATHRESDPQPYSSIAMPSHCCTSSPRSVAAMVYENIHTRQAADVRTLEGVLNKGILVHGVHLYWTALCVPPLPPLSRSRV